MLVSGLSKERSADTAPQARKTQRIATQETHPVGSGLKPLWRHVSTCRCIGSKSPPNAIYSDGERIDQVEALGVLGQDWSEYACVSSSLLYEVRGKLQTQILCGADDNPRRRMSTARSG
jgi:hypothetical protein